MVARLAFAMMLTTGIELALLLKLGELMGIVETVTLIVITGVLGATLTKQEGLSVLQQLQEDTRKGIPPAERLVEGLLVVVGGVLLFTPGVLTDVLGFSFVLGPTRRLFVPPLKGWIMRRFVVSSTDGSFRAGFGPLGAGPAANPSGRRDVGGSASAETPSRGPGGFDHPVQDP